MLVDALILVLLLAIIIRGRETGLVRQLFSAIGFIGGLFLGAMLQPQVLDYADTTFSRAVLSMVVTLGLAFTLASLGEYFGSLLKSRIRNLMPVNKADAVLGSVAGGITLLGGVWLLSSVLGGLPAPSIQQSLQRSAIITALNRSLPSAPNVISGIGHLINPNGFPDVFAGLERRPLQPDTPLPSLGELQPAVQKTRTSIVKLEGRGCGGIVEGSGFVAAKDIIITNAHVVAGVKRPSVIDTNGAHDATVIWFDPNLDVAIVRTSGLAGSPLAMDATRLEAGTPGVVVGYPGGRGFTASPATVLDQFTATGRDIYGRTTTRRNILELRADIIPGNSGGPLINKDGTVIGLIFAESVSYEDIGYALTLQPVVSALEQSRTRTQPVATGACAG